MTDTPMTDTPLPASDLLPVLLRIAAALERAAPPAIPAPDLAAADAFVRAQTEQAQAEKAQAEHAQSERAKDQAIRTAAKTELQKHDTISAVLAQTASESRISFLYGLILGMVFTSLTAAVLLLMQRRKMTAAVKARTEEAMLINRQRQSEFDRMVTAMLTEHERRFSKKTSAAPSHAAIPRPPEQRIDWSALH